MDRKSIIILALSFLLLILWYPMVGKFYPQPPVQRGGTNVVLAVNSNQVVSGGSITGSNLIAPTITAPTLPPALAGAALITAQEQLLSISNDFVRVHFTSVGGGVRSVELLKYPETVRRKPNSSIATNGAAYIRLNALSPVAAMATIGLSANPQDNVFKLIRTEKGVRAEGRLTNGLVVVKDFTLGSDYLVSVQTKIENRTEAPVAVPAHEWVVGSTSIAKSTDDPRLILSHWFDGEEDHKVEEGWFKNFTLGCIPGSPRDLYSAGNNNVKWVSVNNQFFAMAVIASTNSPGGQAVSRFLELPGPSQAELRIDPKLHPKPTGQVAGMLYPSAVLQSRASIERQFEYYAGPKEYKTLAKIGQDRNNEFDLIMDFGSFFGMFSKALLLSMNLLNSWGLSYGLAIITITIIIKIVFWPLTKASTQSMKRMAALQPQMKAIQDKYKDDPKKMNVKLMEFMRDNKVSPLGGCIPMLLQIPVFIGFFFMIQTAIELRGASFLWAYDLSQPDTVAHLLGFPINLLPLLMGATQLWQIKLTPPAPGMDPVQQKIMQYMPLMFMFFLYQYAAGLTLYWTVQNLLSIAQMKLTKNEPTTATPASVPVRPVASKDGKRK